MRTRLLPFIVRKMICGKSSHPSKDGHLVFKTPKQPQPNRCSKAWVFGGGFSVVPLALPTFGRADAKTALNAKSPEISSQWMGGYTGENSGDLTGLQDKTSPIITRTLMRYLKDYGPRLRIAGARAVRLPLRVI